jgi:hypothetical protein
MPIHNSASGKTFICLWFPAAISIAAGARLMELPQTALAVTRGALCSSLWENYSVPSNKRIPY